MAATLKLGHKVRQLRHNLALTQIEMARRLGMSSSYLNLIEHGQRPLTLKLLLRLGEVFQVDLNTFSDSDDGRRLADLGEVLANPLFRDHAVAEQSLRDAVEAAPAFAQAFIDLFRSYSSAVEEITGLREELHSRELTAGLNHDVRTLLTTIRSFSEILRDTPDLDVEQRRRFTDIIIEDSKRLLPLLGGLLEGEAAGRSPAGGRQPAAEAIDFLQSQAGYFGGLEDAAEQLRQRIGVASAYDGDRLADALRRDYGVELRIVAAGVHGAGARYDAEGRRLELSELLSADARAVEAAKCVAALGGKAAVEQSLAGAPTLSAAAAELVRADLIDYLAGALLMPYGPFLAAVKELRHDLERLQGRFGVGYERVCRRLTALQRPGAKGVPFYLLAVDMAGNVLRRVDASGLRIPRFGSVCALWNVHRAFATPATIRAQLSRMPDGMTYLSVARSFRADRSDGLADPPYRAVEIGCDVAFADALVYADGLNLAGTAAVPVGPTCRLCERLDCSQRVLPPFRRSADIAAGGAFR